MREYSIGLNILHTFKNRNRNFTFSLKIKKYYLMKKNTLIACLAIALSASGVSLAQTQQEREKLTQGYNLKNSTKLAQEVQSSTKKNYDRAMRLAKRYNWPLIIEYKDGGFGELVGVLEDDSPLYYRTYNKGGVSTIHADAVHTGGSAGLDLNGENMIAGVWDGGTVRSTHELFEGRVVKKNTSGHNSHPTHVAGTLIGSGAVADGDAIGVAPQATVYSYDWDNDHNEMLAEAEDGLLVSNHSYGIAATDNFGNPILPVSFFGQYRSEARTTDNIQNEFEYYLPVFAAGNDRDMHNILNPGNNGYDLLTGEGVAKNNLVVGSIWEVTDFENPYSVTLSSFSNFGPTDDGRIKPDITAKGHNVYSATAATDSSYAAFSGTSMAAPSVTGGVILIQEHANNTFGNYVNSATIRGLIAHTAYKAGGEGNPNYRYGWGVMNVEEAVAVITNHKESSLVREIYLEEGQSYLTTVKASELDDLIATIAWIDLPGKLSSGHNDRTPVLVNDLDIRLRKVGGDTYFPYILNPDFPTFYPATGDNFRDNIEKIEIVDPEGEYIVAITHKRTLDYLEDEEAKQKFSLILSGITESNLIFETYQNNAHFCETTEDEFSMELLVQTENSLEDTIITVENTPQGLIATIDDSDLENGIVTLNITGISVMAVDTYEFELKAVNGLEEVSLYPSITVTKDEFEGINLVSPANNTDKIPLYVTFKWEEAFPSNRVLSYTLELAADENFIEVLDLIEDIEEPQLFYSQLQRNNDYFWRVKAVGECGEGEFGEVFTFHTYDLSVEDFETTNFVVHPNPATNQVTINSPTLIKQVKIMNMLGQEVMVLNPNSDQVQLNISALSSGNYLLRISDENTTQVKRLMKK